MDSTTRNQNVDSKPSCSTEDTLPALKTIAKDRRKRTIAEISGGS